MQTSFSFRTEELNQFKILSHDAPEADRQEALESNQALLDAFDNPGQIKSEDQYQSYQKISSLLCGLSCSTSNTRAPENDRVWAMEGAYNERIYEWTRKTRVIKEPLIKTLAKYVSMSRFCPNYDHKEVLERIADELVAAGVLFRHEGRLVVAGFDLKLGDNVFSVDRQGREHRRFVQSATPLAIHVNDKSAGHLVEWEKRAVVKDLPAEFRVVYPGDAKGAPRPHRFDRNDLNRLMRFANTKARIAA